MRDNFRSISDSIKHELLLGDYDRIMIYATESTVDRLQDKFRTQILILLASDEETKNKRRDRKRKYYVIKVQREPKITV